MVNFVFRNSKIGPLIYMTWLILGIWINGKTIWNIIEMAIRTWNIHDMIFGHIIYICNIWHDYDLIRHQNYNMTSVGHNYAIGKTMPWLYFGILIHGLYIWAYTDVTIWPYINEIFGQIIMGKQGELKAKPGVNIYVLFTLSYLWQHYNVNLNCFRLENMK